MPANPTVTTLRRGTVAWSLQVFVWFGISLLIAWHLLALADFFYPLWYRLLDIHAAVAQYAPVNSLRANFDQTTHAERLRLFGEIVDSVQNGGNGLEKIVYHDANGQALGSLLTSAEVTHLNDVAQLIRNANWTGLFLVTASVLWLAVAVNYRCSIPAIRQMLTGLISIIAILSAVIVLIGPVKIFYWLHEWIFPQQHQWFFYYEESLMSLLMKAPDLFAPIAILLVLLASILTGMMVYVANRFFCRIIQ